MDLESFVQNTLLQIIKGVTNAEKELNPKLDGRFFTLLSGDDGGVSFQVAVTVEKERNSKRGGGASIKIVEAGISKSDRDKFENASIIRFKVDFSHKSLRL